MAARTAASADSNTFDRRTNNESQSDTVVSSLVSLFGSNKVNEARARYTYNTTDSYSPLTADSGVASRTPDFSNVPVSVSRAGVGNTGPPTALPQNLVEKRLQFVNNFSIRTGAHQWKFGGDVIQSWRFVTFFNNFAGTYTFAAGTPFPFDPANPATYPFQYTQSFGTSGLNFNDTMGALFAQDDWEIARGVTLNLGVRWDVDTLIQGDHNNVAPRVGFAWNVGNTGKTVIRGNTGIFYDTLESSLINRESNFGPVGQAALDLRQGDPLFPTFPNRLTAFPTGSRRGAARDGHGPGLRGRRLPVQHRRHAAAHRAVLLQLDDRLPARARAELGDVGRLRARPRATT